MEHNYSLIKEKILNQNALLFDVRELQEWEEDHITQAHFVPLSGLQINAKELAQQFDKNKEVYLHCRSGVRVLKAAPLLEQAGFNKVIPLIDSILQLPHILRDKVKSFTFPKIVVLRVY